MADIIQAANWLLEGHTVARQGAKFKLIPVERPWRFIYDVECEDGGLHQLDAYDLLASDWEKLSEL
jgi:hypothetical protein